MIYLLELRVYDKRHDIFVTNRDNIIFRGHITIIHVLDSYCD